MRRLLLAVVACLLWAVPASAQMNCVIQNGTTYCGNGVVFTTPVFVTSQGFTSAAGTAADTFLVREAPNTLSLKNGDTAQAFRVWGNVTSTRYLKIAHDGTQGIIGTVGTGSLFIETSGTDRWKWDVNGHFLAVADNTYNIGSATGTDRPAGIFLAAPAITVGSGTGITVNDKSELRDPVYKVTIDKSAFVCNATTCDVTIGTLPANTRLLQVDASLTTTFACTATCTTSTLSMVLGKGSGGSEYLASFDADAATAWLGDADAELGTLMVRAAAINGGTFTTGSQAVVLRLTSGTGAVGTGSATNLSQGSVTIFLHTLTMP